MVDLPTSTLAFEGISIRQATRRLNASPWKPRGGGQWAPATVGKILTNEAYYGVAYYNRRRSKQSDRTDLALQRNHKTMREWRPREE